ncbi:MAG: galactokinase [Clostridia bacterium]|nr:galactokinase [Clostridia bacterium]
MDKFDIFADNAAYEAMCGRIFHTDGEAQRARFQSLIDAHEEYFCFPPEEFYSSPGRIEIIGNHTDHNGGKVLCASINFDTLGAVSPRRDGIIKIKYAGYPVITVDTFNDIEFLMSQVGTSVALVKGVVDYFVRSGKKVGGFNASITANVPKGSGVSSSSSFELIVAEILNVMYNDGELDAIFKAKASQYAENIYFGKPSGLMDQSAIALGGVNLIDFSNLKQPTVERANWAFDDLDIYVISTGGDHSNLTDDYAAIPEEMKEVAACFDKKLLHEITREQWESEKAQIKNKVSERAYLRAEHFFEENERVENAVKAIDDGDEKAFIDIVNASGLSSRYKLQNTYSVRGGNHNIENALDKVVHVEGVKASRVHGGGFAGTILVLADKNVKSTDEELRAMFGSENVFKLAIREDGATRLN